MSLEMAVALTYGVPCLIAGIAFAVVIWLDYRDGGMPPPPEPPDWVAIFKARDANG